MRHPFARGILAGAAGTIALDVATYLDMAVRGRPPSSLPSSAAGRLAGTLHLPLGEGEAADNRRSGLGALLGYATGLGVGVGYGLLRSRRRLPVPVAALGLAVAAMAGSDVPLTASHLTDPRRWSAADWASDVVPHLAYGAAAAVAYEIVAASR